ncbi:MAG: hypothetical protein KJP17_04935 [Gammaproteobacteria bacterium]|nr:hypothetical protein [Gammaproteobacteria bacterium]
MAEHIKDDEDRMLEQMFASPPLADDGFSVRVVRKVRRRIWVRRLTLPIATLIGAVISFQPLTSLVTTLAGFAQLIPQDIVNVSSAIIPQAPTLVLGGLLLAVCMAGLRALED